MQEIVLTNSVGRGGVNKDPDVRIVQTLLNRQILPPSRLLKVDGIAGANTKTAIIAFQHRLGIASCNGLVTPGSRTLNALYSLPHSVPLSEQLLNSLNTVSRQFSDAGHYVIAEVENYFSPRANDKHPVPPQLIQSPQDAIAWGAKVSLDFKKRIVEICNELVIVPDFLMSCIAFETCETFKPDILNKNSGAIGLIQFTGPAIETLGTTKYSLSKMSGVQQLDYVKKYFSPYKKKIETLEDIYMVILCPAAVGKGAGGVVY